MNSVLKTRSVFILAALLVLTLLVLSVLALLGSSFGLLALVILLGVAAGYILATFITHPRRTRKRALTLLAVLWVSFFVVSLFNAGIRFMPPWLASFFGSLETTAGAFGYGVMMGLGMIFFIRLTGFEHTKRR